MSDIEILEDKKEMFIDTLYECYRQSEVKPFEKALENLIQENKKLYTEIASSVYWLGTPSKDIEKQYMPKSKVKEHLQKLAEKKVFPTVITKQILEELFKEGE